MKTGPADSGSGDSHAAPSSPEPRWLAPTLRDAHQWARSLASVFYVILTAGVWALLAVQTLVVPIYTRKMDLQMQQDFTLRDQTEIVRGFRAQLEQVRAEAASKTEAERQYNEAVWDRLDKLERRPSARGAAPVSQPSPTGASGYSYPPSKFLPQKVKP